MANKSNKENKTKEVFNKIGAILESKEISKKLNVNGLECYVIDLSSSFSIICDDIIHNQCKNIYDFNIERGLIFQK